MTGARQPEPTAPLFELGGLFANIDTLETTPLELLDLPREIAPGVIVRTTSSDDTPADPSSSSAHYWPDLDPTRPENRAPEPCKTLTLDRRPEYAGFCAVCMHPEAAHACTCRRYLPDSSAELVAGWEGSRPCSTCGHAQHNHANAGHYSSPCTVGPPARCASCSWADNPAGICPGRYGLACADHRADLEADRATLELETPADPGALF